MTVLGLQLFCNKHSLIHSLNIPFTILKFLKTVVGIILNICLGPAISMAGRAINILWIIRKNIADLQKWLIASSSFA